MEVVVILVVEKVVEEEGLDSIWKHLQCSSKQEYNML